MKRLLPHLALASFSLVVGLLVAELALRVVDYQYHPMKIDVASENDARLFHTFDDSHFVWDPQLFWRPRPGVVPFNQQGFRGPELAEQKRPGEVRIFAIGDSNTLGWAEENGPNWPRYLQDRLAPICPSCMVINAGVWGYASLQGLARLEDVSSFEPDIVLISFGANDAHLVSRTDREFAEQTERWMRYQLPVRLRLADLALAALGAIPEKHSGPLRHRVDLDSYRSNLVETIARCRELGALPVLLTRPYTGEIPHDQWWKVFASDYAVATLDVARSENVPAIDVFTEFRGRQDLFSDESHFTEDGHRHAAQLMTTRLLPELARRRGLVNRGAVERPGSEGEGAVASSPR